MEHMMENMKTEMKAMDAESPTELGLGAQLRLARERAGLGRAEAARNLRVTDRVIERLEYELFDELPAPIYVRGYLRQYAALLHMPPEETEEMVHLYNRTYAERPAPLIRESLRQRLVDRQFGFRVWPVLTVLVAAATLLGLWLFGGQPNLSQVSDVLQDKPATNAMPGADTTTMSGSQQQPSVVPQKTSPPAKPGKQRTMPVGRDEATAVSHNSHSPAGQDWQPDRAMSAKERARDNPDANANGQPPPGSLSGQEAQQSIQPGLAASSPTAAVPGLRDVQFQFSKDCWIEVRDADGRKILASMGRAGETKSIHAKAPLAVMLGNARGVAILVDGKKFDFSKYLNKSQISRFRIPAADNP